jgi:hypothetical protein
MPAAATFTNTSFEPKDGLGLSSNCKTSGPPGWLITIAFIRVNISLVNLNSKNESA